MLKVDWVVDSTTSLEQLFWICFFLFLLFFWNQKVKFKKNKEKFINHRYAKIIN